VILKIEVLAEKVDFDGEARSVKGWYEALWWPRESCRLVYEDN
jgi:hypothetical protein